MFFRNTEILGLSLVQNWLTGSAVEAITIGQIAESVFIYLGIPFIAGFLIRFILIRVRSKEWYNTKFVPKISPLTIYFIIMFLVSFFMSKKVGATYEQSSTL